MEFNKPVSNPMMMGFIELLKEDPSEEHRSMFVNELVKGSYMAPVNLVPAPVQTPDGRWVVDPDTQFHFPFLKTTDGKEFFMGFTDQAEFDKWVEVNRPAPYFALNFEDYANMMFLADGSGKACTAEGLVINPMGANVVIPRAMMAGILITKLPEVQAHIAKIRNATGMNDDIK